MEGMFESQDIELRKSCMGGLPDNSGEKQGQRQDTLSCFKKLLYERSDEIPDERISGTKDGVSCKVQINWWTAACGWIDLALRQELFKDDQLKEECAKFVGKYASKNYWNHGEKLTTREEINEANMLLRKVIANLEEKDESVIHEA